MKRVAVYRTVFPLASETFIREQMRAMREYSPTLVCRDYVGDENPPRQTVISVRQEGARDAEAIRFTLLRRSHRLEHALNRLEPNLIHAHFAPDAVMIGPTAARLGLPLLVTCHGFDVQMNSLAMLQTRRPTNLHYLLGRRTLFKQARAFIAVSEFLKGVMLANGFPADRMRVHYIGVDTRRFSPVAGRSEKVVLNVSRHVGWKGIDVILRAFAKIAPRFPDWRLVQIGAGGESGRLRALAGQLGIGQRVEWLGARPHDVVLDHMRRASIYVQASRRDEAGQTEAFGMVLLEAAACAVPVIATRSGGMPEAIAEGSTGLLFPEGDAAALADRLELLLADDNVRQRMGASGRDLALRFDIHAQTSKLEAIYDELGGY